MTNLKILKATISAVALSVIISESVRAESVLGSGICGENAETGTKCEWKVVDLGNNKKELQITSSDGGNVSMDDFNARWGVNILNTNVPWRNYQSSLTSVKVGRGITSIGNGAFVYASNCSNIDLTGANDLIHIGRGPFRMSAIQNVTVPASVKTVGDGFISDMSVLQSLTFLGDIPDFGGTAIWGDDLTRANIKIYYDKNSATASEKLEAWINATKQQYSFRSTLIECLPQSDGSKDLFDDEGKMLKRIDTNGNLVQTYGYNENGLLNAIYDPDGNILRSYGYNSKGQLSTIYDENGNELEKYTYDAGGNLVSAYQNGKAVYLRKRYTIPEADAATQGKGPFRLDITW